VIQPIDNEVVEERRLEERVARLERMVALRAREGAACLKLGKGIPAFQAEKMEKVIAVDPEVHEMLPALRGTSRVAYVVGLRWKAMQLLTEAGYGCSDIGRFLNHDHGTVLFARNNKFQHSTWRKKLRRDRR